MKNISESYRDVENKLRSYKKIKCKILNLKIDLDILVDEFQGIKGVDYSSECISSKGKVTSSVENEIIQKEKKIDKIESEIKKLEREIEKIDNVLNILTEREKKIIELIYFDNYRNYHVARKIDLTEQTLSCLKKELIYKLIPLLES